MGSTKLELESGITECVRSIMIRVSTGRKHVLSLSRMSVDWVYR